MKNKILFYGKRAGLEKIDWKLLIFLLLFLNFKLIIKIFALVLIYALRPDLKFRFKTKRSRLPLFYFAMIGIAILNWLFIGVYDNFNYTLVLITGILFWVLCILAIHQIKLAVEKNEPEIIHRTIIAFFIINAIVSLSVYAGIVWETGAINPYRYQGNYQKYFIGTGDYIKGLTFDTSTTNAVISALGVIYFIVKEKYALTILCMFILLLTGSNVTNLLLFFTLLYIFLFQGNKDQKSIIIVCLVMLITFLAKVSPQNFQYVTAAWQKMFKIQMHDAPKQKSDISIREKPDSILTPDERKQKFAQIYLDSIFTVKQQKMQSSTGVLPAINIISRPIIPGDSIHTPKFQYKGDTNLVEKKLIQFVNSNTGQLPIASHLLNKAQKLPGKLVALKQTFNFFSHHPTKLLTGNGIGNFSSKLAFRATSMNITGGYPARFAYINNDFETNHLDLYLFYFTNRDNYHSVANSPNSTYDQLISEYGLAGLVSFIFFYIAFFIKQVKLRSVAVPLLLFMLGAFFIEYWFEQLSVVIFFELLILLNIKENTAKNNAVA